MALGAAAKAIVKSADHTAVGIGLASSGDVIRAGAWISTRNEFFKDAVSKLDNMAAGKHRGQAFHRYVGASAPVHAYASSRYLGLALRALLNRDFDGAMHLAYYSELRAAMSILASQGIGVFKNIHAVVIGKHEIERLTNGGRTHDFVWGAFEVWSGEKMASDFIGGALSAWSLSLNDFCEALFGRGALQPFVQSLLIEWGMDLKTHFEDRDARNEASYRPTFSANICKSVLPITFVQDFWSCFEPTNSQPFEFLDRWLFLMCFKKLKPQLPIVGAVADRLGAYGVSQANSIAKFLASSDRKLPFVLKFARGNIRAERSLFTMGMLSRASLLLRVAIAATRRTLDDAGIQALDIEWWFTSIIASAGLSETAAPDPIDLWDDVKNALDDCQLLDADVSQKILLTDNGDSLAALQQCERLTVWGLAL